MEAPCAQACWGSWCKPGYIPTIQVLTGSFVICRQGHARVGLADAGGAGVKPDHGRFRRQPLQRGPPPAQHPQVRRAPTCSMPAYLSAGGCTGGTRVYTRMLSPCCRQCSNHCAARQQRSLFPGRAPAHGLLTTQTGIAPHFLLILTYPAAPGRAAGTGCAARRGRPCPRSSRAWARGQGSSCWMRLGPTTG